MSILWTKKGVNYWLNKSNNYNNTKKSDFIFILTFIPYFQPKKVASN